MGSNSEHEISELDAAFAAALEQFKCLFPIFSKQDSQTPQDKLLDMTGCFDLQSPQNTNLDMAGHFREWASLTMSQLSHHQDLCVQLHTKIRDRKLLLDKTLKDLDNSTGTSEPQGAEQVSARLKQSWQQKDRHVPDQSLNGLWSRFDMATKSFKCLIDHETVYRWYINEAINRLLEENAMYAELRPMPLDDCIPSLLDLPNERPSQSASKYKTPRHSSHWTLEEGIGWRHINQSGQSLTYLGGPHMHTNRLPSSKALVLYTLFFGSCAGMLLSGVHLPGGMRTVTGVLSTSGAVANIPMHMRKDYIALRWGLLAFCMVAYAAFLAFLCESLKGKRHRPAYLFFAIFGGVSAIGSTLFADKVEDTVQSILTFGPLALTLTAGLLYMPFRYGFSIGANAVGDVEMQTPNSPDRQLGQ